MGELTKTHILGWKLRWKVRIRVIGAQGRTFFWNRDTSINNSYTRRAPQGKFLCFSSKIPLKLHNCISNENLTHRCTQTKQFFLFSKRTWETSALPPSPPAPASCVPKLIYFLKRGWYSTNFFFMTISKFSKTSLSILRSTASHG